MTNAQQSICMSVQIHGGLSITAEQAQNIIDDLLEAINDDLQEAEPSHLMGECMFYLNLDDETVGGLTWDGTVLVCARNDNERLKYREGKIATREQESMFWELKMLSKP